MSSGHVRSGFRYGKRWAAGIGLALALGLPAVPAAAQPIVPTPIIVPSPISVVTPGCAVRLSVANPSPGNQEIPRSLIMSGTAVDTEMTPGAGISQVQAFLGPRDQGGTVIGSAVFGLGPTDKPGAWNLSATIPINMSGGQDLFVYATSTSGQMAVVEIPIVVAGQQLPADEVSTTGQSFCTVVQAPTAPLPVALGR